MENFAPHPTEHSSQHPANPTTAAPHANAGTPKRNSTRPNPSPLGAATAAASQHLVTTRMATSGKPDTLLDPTFCRVLPPGKQQTRSGLQHGHYNQANRNSGLAQDHQPGGFPTSPERNRRP
ncbi:hypothetical protein CCHOA_00210 [Corynebacterium choanae]|uniref:Uncharacterized protein n=1 Tax=Corynebacterium choanae TaxID=1862358 RepID=A0A3G6J8Y0_9CORY|nr:hypothetical protein CCHOA_00210 [Corynebacterium choanae]